MAVSVRKLFTIKRLLAFVAVVALTISSLLSNSAFLLALFLSLTFLIFLVAFIRFLVPSNTTKNSQLAFAVCGCIYLLFAYIPDSKQNSPRQISMEPTTVFISWIWDRALSTAYEIHEDDIFLRAARGGKSAFDANNNSQDQDKTIGNLSLIVTQGGNSYFNMAERKERFFIICHCLFSLVVALFSKVLFFIFSSSTDLAKETCTNGRAV